jgi:glycosyltransferase involved in cell wall biosynthesis
VRICMIASTYPRYDDDGVGRFNRSLAEAIASLGHEVHVLIPFDRSIRPYPSPVHVHPYRYIWPERWNKMGYAQAMDSDRQLKPHSYLLIVPFLLFGALALWRLVRRYRVDLIHAHWVIPNGPIGLAVSLVARVPLFVSLHGSDVFMARRTRLFGNVATAVFRRARAITACSPELYQGAIELGARSEHTHLVLWGADPSVFATRSDSDQIAESLGLGRSSAVILALGRLVGKKGFDVLIEALAEVFCSYPEARCVIVGGGSEGPRLRALAAELGVVERTIFTGPVAWTEVPRYLALSDVFVAPSVHDVGNLDGLPTVILEAMAAGRPVVASDVAGIPLVVGHEKTGLLVQERDPKELARAISLLLDRPDLREQYGRAGQERVRRELNWDQVAQRFVEMYEGAIRAV